MYYFEYVVVQGGWLIIVPTYGQSMLDFKILSEWTIARSSTTHFLDQFHHWEIFAINLQ